MNKDDRAAAKIILADTREPWPHPWERFLPEGWVIERGTLETGDLALAMLPEAGVVERKTSSRSRELYWQRPRKIRTRATARSIRGTHGRRDRGHPI